MNPDIPDIRVQLAAYLAGELDEDAVEALEHRMGSEPWVAALADDMATMLVALGRPDDVAPPAGFGARLRDGLAEQIGHPLPTTGPADSDVRTAATALTGWSTGSDGRNRAGRSRNRPAQRWYLTRRPLGIAATLVVIAVASVSVLAGLRGGTDEAADSETAAFDDADLRIDAAEEQADDAAGPLVLDGADEDSAEGGVEALAVPESAEAPAEVQGDSAAPDAAGLAGAAAAPGPEVHTLPEVEEDAVRQVLATSSAITALLGLPAESGPELAVRYGDELMRGPAFDDGTPAAVCLPAVRGASDDPAIPAVAVRADLPDGPVVGYGLVRSRDGRTLDAVDLWVLALPACTVDRVIPLR